MMILKVLTGFAIALGLGQEGKPVAPAAPPAETKTAPPTPENSKGRFKRKSTDDKPFNTPDAKTKSAGPPEAPPVDASTERAIPKPEADKERPPVDQSLLDALGQDLPTIDADAESDPLLRAGQRMRSVEEQLARADLGEQTLEMQRKIVADLAELLDAANQPPPDNSSPPGQNDSKDQQKKKNQSKKKKGSASKQKRQGNPGQQQKQSGQEQGQAMANRPSQQSNSDSASRGKAQPPSADPGRTRKDIWGHLSETQRDQMGQYAKDKLLPKYRELLELYYTTIASGETNARPVGRSNDR